MNTLEAQIREFGPWWHQIDLGNGIRTRDIHPQRQDITGNDYPFSFWKHLQHVIPVDMSGLNVLDIGCSDGFFSLECAKRNAASVVSIDTLSKRIRNLSFVAEHLGLKTVHPKLQSVYDLDPTEQFDVVLMLGVLYHLDHPLLALQKVSAITDMLLLETTVLQNEVESVMEWRKAHCSEIGWNPSLRCLHDMLHSVGFTSMKLIPRPGDERVTVLCTRQTL